MREEITRITSVEELEQNRPYKQFRLWATRRLPLLKIMNFIFLFGAIYAYSEIVYVWLKIGVFLYIRFIAYIPYLIFAFYIYPRWFVKLICKQSNKVYGKEYIITFSMEGLQINNQPIALKKRKKILENEYGLALIDFRHIIVICGREAFSSIEYDTIKKWMKNY